MVQPRFNASFSKPVGEVVEVGLEKLEGFGTRMVSVIRAQRREPYHVSALPEKKLILTKSDRDKMLPSSA
jgi:hypothetical protein